ncbi:quinone oxidoreductase family protein [Brevibacterium casei]|uniref:Zinc-binding dehydrogenase n=1 Tax=Brevibacterium casei TaxID=33889 RepID=A0A7T4A0J3_9MICO|nr:zinc-binding dehydrogenase [Brevibacterium casei]QQB15078.1 zinc-binding dehydrogenase [Brevibacterium casei]
MKALTTSSAHAGLIAADVRDPVPGPKDVAVDVEFAGIGMIDALWSFGKMPTTPGFVPGLEVVGIVRATGSDVTHVARGQRVAAIPLGGGFAEVALASAALVSILPDGLDPALASVVPINTVTAHLALTTVARLAPEETILVHAGVGGLGSQFAEVARTLGAGPIAAVVGTPDKADIARELGYDRVWLRTDLGEVPRDTFDLVVDPVGGRATETAFSLLRSGGRLLRVGNASQTDDVRLSSIEHWLENKTTAGFNVGAWLAADPDAGTRSLQWALDAVARGAVRVSLTDVVGPDEINTALSSLLRGETTGKLAVDMRGLSI